MRIAKQQTIPYRDEGSGPALVLINGLGRTSKHWLGFDRALAAHYRVITFDLRGAGSSVQPCTWQLKIDDMVNDLIDLLDSLALKKVHIFGVSLGGMVAMSCSLRFPERCLSLTLVNSSAGFPRTPRISLAAVTFIARSALTRPAPLKANRYLADLVLGKTFNAEQRLLLAQQLTELDRVQAPNMLNVLKQSLAALRFKALGIVRVPTLIIRGSADAFVPPLNSQKLADWIPDATLLTIDGGGHELQFDRAAELLDLHLNWIRTCM